MGCDGGTIPKRDELVKLKKKPEKNAKEVENSAKWNYCHLSQQILRMPIVADLLGFLYNKDILIEFLLERSKYEAGPAYVKSLKDVKELNLTTNPGFVNSSDKKSNDQSFLDLNQSRWICPITGLEMNGIYRFFYIFSCGCVISERAMKTMQSSDLVCLKCEKSYTENDLIVLNPNEEDLKLNEDKYNARKEAIKAKKNQKSIEKTIKIEKTFTPENTNILSVEEKTLAVTKNNETKKIDAIKFETNVCVATTSNASASKRSASTSIESSKKAKTTSSSSNSSTIQNDPNASKVYKSIFTTCDKAKNQQKAHWVTFNPQYF